MIKAKKIAAIALVTAVALIFSGCLGVQKVDQYSLVPESTGGKDVEPAPAADSVISLNYNRKYSLNPIIATNHSNQLVCNLVYENMVEIDNNFDVIPNIITEWTHNEGGTVWNFKLDTTHVFHDGTPVRGIDLSYSLQRCIFSDRFTGRFASFQGCNFSDDSLEVYLGIGDTQFVKLLNVPVVKYGTYTVNRDDFPPVGSGPYAFSEDLTQIVAFEGYPGYENLPVDTIYLVEYTTAADILSAFEDSYIDIALNDPSSYSSLGFASSDETHPYATTNMHYVIVNHESDVGKYVAFRYAMNYAFDRDYFADQLMSGNAVASSVPMYPTCSLYPSTLADSLDYDIEVCKRILENGGIMDYDDDGKLEIMQGAPDLTIRFLVCSDNSAKNGVVNRFASDMESIGITVEVQSVVWDTYIEALENGEFDLYYGEMKLRADFDVTELFDIRTKDNEDWNINYSGNTDPSFLNYINAYLSAGGPDSNGDVLRRQKYIDMVKYITDDGGLITIGFEKQQLIVHRGIIRGVAPNAGNPLYDFPNWQITIN